MINIIIFFYSVSIDEFLFGYGVGIVFIICKIYNIFVIKLLLRFFLFKVINFIDEDEFLDKDDFRYFLCDEGIEVEVVSIFMKDFIYIIL